MGEAARGLRPAGLAAFAALLAGCATPPEVKRDYMEAAAWRGGALTVVGRRQVVDAAAGAAPQSLTLIDVDARAEIAGGAARRAEIVGRRVRRVEAELVRAGIAPVDIGETYGSGVDGVQTFPPADLQAKRIVVVAHD